MALEIQSETREIDGYEFTIQQLASTECDRVLERITRALGPAVAQLTDPGKAVATLFERLTPKELAELKKILLEKCLVKIEGNEVPLKGVYELIFAGRLTRLYALLGFALEVNYRDFWQKVSGHVEGLLATLSAEFLSRSGSSVTGHTSASSSAASPASPSSAPSTASTAPQP